MISYLVVNTSNWWSGHRVLVAPRWIKDVSWSEAKISVDLIRQVVKDSPPYDSAAQLDRQREHAMQEHHGRREYWTTEANEDTAAPPAE